MINFKNSYTSLPPKFFERISPEKFQDPRLIIFNNKLAKNLKIDTKNYDDNDLAQVFSGQKVLEGSDPIAMAYAGFQFGHPVEQLGDGRAHLLGEAENFDIQLKGSGRTRFSRRGDGRSALGPVLREYLLSEAMHVYGVPTTRALAAVTTGESVYRQDGPEPGGVLTRVADSHIRVGTFQYFSFQGDLDSLELLLDYTLNRHFPDVLGYMTLKEKSLELLKRVSILQAQLIAKWSSLGFIHGVMNTDNCSPGGITIDYGPCAFMDEFRFHKVFSSIDRLKRYSFFNQLPIAQWNVLRLADCFIPFIDDHVETAASIVNKELTPYFEKFADLRTDAFARKLGLNFYQQGDEEIVTNFLEYLENHSLDFTQSFRNLEALYNGDDEGYPQSEPRKKFLTKWKARNPDFEGLNLENPYIIPRNHLVEKAIKEAYEGNYDFFIQFHEALSDPYSENDTTRPFSAPPALSERVYQTFCGT
ncbi:MAG: protein adenylyltransferase SelO [Bacteriovoracaceae bacterium]